MSSVMDEIEETASENQFHLALAAIGSIREVAEKAIEAIREQAVGSKAGGNISITEDIHLHS